MLRARSLLLPTASLVLACACATTAPPAVEVAPGAGDAPGACPLGEHLVGGVAEPAALESVVAVRKKAWEASLGGEVAARPFVRARLVGWPRHALADRATLPPDDEGFLRRVARDTWRGLDAFSDRENGLPLDHVRFAPGTVDPERAQVGDYTNVTTIGLRLVAIVAARELDLIDEAGARGRVERILSTLEGLESHRGFFYNWYDTTSLERTSNLLSFVDSSWLMAGLIVVRERFPELAGRAGALVERTDLGMLYDAENGLMRHGWWVQTDEPSRYHYGVLYAESRLGSVLAIGKGDVPASHWFRPARTLAPACGWQRQEPLGRGVKEIDGIAYHGGYYRWKDVDYVPSWGGSAFEALMPTLVLDEPRLVPDALGANDRAHAEVQRRFATEELGWPVWGMSPSAAPGTERYGEYGVPALGILGYPPGVVTPHAAALALAVEPGAATRALAEMARRYDVYGEFGFYDALDPVSGAVAPVYLALDQEMLFIAVANHLTGGRVQQLFASDPIVQRALPVLRRERFFE